MRGKRAKQYRKLMHQYALSFSFREPYQVLLDAQMIQDAARYKMNLGAGLERTLHGEIKPMITQCSIRHLYTAETSNKAEKDAWIETAKACERRRCGHHELEQPLSTLECLQSVVDPKGSGTNRHRYVVASQDPEVRRKMREIAGVPLVYINRSVMIMEPMAGKSAEVRDAEERGKVRAGLKGRRPASSGVKRKRDSDDEGAQDGAELEGRDVASSAEPAQKKKRNGPKGPNPLSVKKAKKEPSKPSTAAAVEEERQVVLKAAKTDPQAHEKAVDAAVATDGATDGTTDGARKRKRRRKPDLATDGNGVSAMNAVTDGE